MNTCSGPTDTLSLAIAPGGPRVTIAVGMRLSFGWIASGLAPGEEDRGRGFLRKVGLFPTPRGQGDGLQRGDVAGAAGPRPGVAQRAPPGGGNRRTECLLIQVAQPRGGDHDLR